MTISGSILLYVCLDRLLSAVIVHTYVHVCLCGKIAFLEIVTVSLNGDEYSMHP